MSDENNLLNNMSSKSDLQFTSSESSNFDFGDSGSNLDFTSTGSSNFDFGDSNSNLEFTSTVSSNIDETKTKINIGDSIDVHRIVNPKKAGHYNTIVKGITNLEKDKLKALMSTIKKKLGIGGGALMKSEDIDPDNDVILFSGDFAEKIKTIIVKELQVDETKITIYK